MSLSLSLSLTLPISHQISSVLLLTLPFSHNLSFPLLLTTPTSLSSQIFIANPDQAKEIKNLLLINKQQLVEFMAVFQDSNSDQEFINERTYVLQKIQDIWLPVSWHMALYVYLIAL